MTEGKTTGRMVLLLATIFVLGVCGLAAWYLKWKSNMSPSFGDWFAAVNALFAGLAFVGLLGTLL